MTVYAVYLNQGDDGAWQALRDKWADHCFIVDDQLAFVTLSGLTTTKDVVEVAGINSEDQRQGLVLQIGAYAGFNRGEIWEWLDKAQSI